MGDREAIDDLERRLAASEAANAALRGSEQRLRHALRATRCTVWEAHLPAGRVRSDEALRTESGSPSELAGPDMEWHIAHIHPDDRERVVGGLEQAVAGADSTWSSEFRHRRADGTYAHVVDRGFITRDASGRALRMTGTTQDVTARKLAETALHESEGRFHRLFDAIDEGLAVVELVYGTGGEVVDMVYRQVNGAYERQGGFRDAVGRSVSGVSPGIGSIWLDRCEHVGRTGEPVRARDHRPDVDRWFDVHFSRADEIGHFVAIVVNDVTERRRVEAALRESEEQQAFLLTLSDALRPLVDPVAVQAAAARMLGERLGANRVHYGENMGDVVVIGQGYGDGLPPMVGSFRPLDFGERLVAAYRAGHTAVCRDVDRDPSITGAERAVITGAGFRAYVAVPLVKEATWRATLAVHSIAPRDWTTGEIALVEAVAERTWAAVERARAEATLRESEARFQQFAKASAAGLWIRDAGTLTMEYVSPAVATIYGAGVDALLGDVKRWAAMIVPEDRGTALEHLRQARAGEAVVHEFRIRRPSDAAFRWIRDTDFPLHDDGHIPRIGGIAEDVTEAKLAAQHSAVLLAELQHRVRNIMAMVRSITARTGEGAASVTDYAALMAGRLLTLARVQALLTRAANAGVDITGIVRAELEAQAQHEGQYTIAGPEVVLSPKGAEVLTLAVHELTTNALKYGALSSPQGRVGVRWATFERRGAPWLGFDWAEEGAPERPPPDPAVPRRRGFGSELIEGRLPYELGGRGTLTIGPGGARCHLEFPLRDGDSVLETDAPQRATVFGGALDMMDEADLNGCRVLVIEDDYYLATDTMRALEGAGAEVLGPCPSEDAAREALADQRPDAAVVDINLGRGASFEVAKLLKHRGIPLVFTTGYDPEVVPAEFDGVERLQKPVELRQIVAAVAKLVNEAP